MSAMNADRIDTERIDTERRAPSGSPGRDASTGLLVLRIALGSVFIGHGAQKLFGAFGGNGIDGTARFFESSGYSPGRPLAILAGLAEFGGGILLVLGLATSCAGAALIATMMGALATKLSGSTAFFAMDGGFEFELLLTVAVLALTLTGAGRYAADHRRFADRPFVRVAAAAIGLVVGGITMVFGL